MPIFKNKKIDRASFIIVMVLSAGLITYRHIQNRISDGDTQPAMVAPSGVVIPNELRVRSGPSTSFPEQDRLTKNTAVTITERYHDTKFGFIENKNISNSRPHAVVLPDRAIVKAGASSQSKTQDTLHKNYGVKVLSEDANGWVNISYHTEFVRIRYAEGKAGFVNSGYLIVHSLPPRTSSPNMTPPARPTTSPPPVVVTAPKVQEVVISSLPHRVGAITNRISSSGWHVTPIVLSSPVAECIRFTIDFEFTRVTSGNPFGNQDVYIMSENGIWSRVGSLAAPQANKRVTTTIHLASPTKISAVAVVPAKAASGQNEFQTAIALRNIVFQQKAQN
jgi:uncharacterized protein YgiM (DUF1202 family)